MAEPADMAGEVEKAIAQTGLDKAKPSEVRAARRNQALRLRVAGLTFRQIADRLHITEDGARQLVRRTLSKAENQNVAEARALENERLDTAQSVIWGRVLEGDIKAIDAYLRILNQRIKINGIAAPTQIDLNIGIRSEMEDALANLERMVNLRGPVIDVQVDENPEDDSDILDAEFSEVEDDDHDDDEDEDDEEVL